MPVHVPEIDWTAERALALPNDGNRHEVLDGELVVTPAPSVLHQQVLSRLFAALSPYVTGQQLGWLLWSPADLVFSSRRLVQPDLFIVPLDHGRLPREWSEITTLLLAIEVLSPSTARADRHAKRLIYQEQGVAEYWIVDTDARLVERWRPADTRPEIMHGQLAWQPRPELEPLRIDVPALFE
jgi:Uma2 family endonuclease